MPASAFGASSCLHCRKFLQCTCLRTGSIVLSPHLAETADKTATRKSRLRWRRRRAISSSRPVARPHAPSGRSAPRAACEALESSPALSAASTSARRARDVFSASQLSKGHCTCVCQGPSPSCARLGAPVQAARPARARPLRHAVHARLAAASPPDGRPVVVARRRGKTCTALGCRRAR
jgi:hypothetical protein